MEHSVAAYLARLPKEKAEQLWQQWVVENGLPSHISSELVEILRLRLKELEEKTSP